MPNLTELRITADLYHHYEDDRPPRSLEELTMLQRLTVDYQHMDSWMDPVPIVISDAAKLTELRIAVHREVSNESRSLCFVAEDQSPTWTILCELNGQSC